MVEQEKRAIYPGSFDPPTNGHKWVIEQVAGQFDHGYAAIGLNPDKTGRFSPDAREEMLKEITSKYSNITVASFLGMYQADFAEIMGANYIVRGVRNPSDFAYESDVIHVNKEINPNLLTVNFVPPKELLQVSSSMVMGLVGFEGWEREVSKMVPESVFTRLKERQDKIEKEKLSTRYLNLWQRLKARGDIPSEFEKLYTKYQEPHRAYHTISHIKMCLNELDLVADQAEDPETLELAIWYHDAIYNSHLSTPHDDEGESAELAQAVAKKLLAPSGIGERAGKLIITTKHKEQPHGRDAKILNDIDLAILGRSSRLFDIYEEQIRDEYKTVPDSIFAQKRTEILEAFLKRDHIYSTPFFRERYENQARKNLERSIKKLSFFV